MDPKEKSISLDEFLFRKLQPIRILKNYDFFREPQLELFKSRRRKK